MATRKKQPADVYETYGWPLGLRWPDASGPWSVVGHWTTGATETDPVLVGVTLWKGVAPVPDEEATFPRVTALGPGQLQDLTGDDLRSGVARPAAMISTLWRQLPEAMGANDPTTLAALEAERAKPRGKRNDRLVSFLEWIVAHGRVATARGPRRRRIDVEHLQEVASVYAAARTRPTKTVAEHFGYSHSTAAKWVARATEAGLLPKTTAGATRRPQLTRKGR